MPRKTREGRAAYMRDFRARNRDQQHAWRNTPEQKQRDRSSDRKWRYGVTPEQFEELLTAQGGGCAICGAEANNLDHEHSTGRVRGVLCGPCNRGLGLFKDDPSRLEKAAAYVCNHPRPE